MHRVKQNAHKSRPTKAEKNRQENKEEPRSCNEKDAGNPERSQQGAGHGQSAQHINTLTRTSRQERRAIEATTPTGRKALDLGRNPQHPPPPGNNRPATADAREGSPTEQNTCNPGSPTPTNKPLLFISRQTNPLGLWIVAEMLVCFGFLCRLFDGEWGKEG